MLKRAFKERTVDKRYHAVVPGPPRPVAAARSTRRSTATPSHDYRCAVVAGGRPSVTHYDTLEAFRAASLLDIQLETGRTHQIRVHLSALRHPCVGDLTYGADPTLAKRLRLDAAVAARPLARLRAPRRRAVGRVRQPLPGRSGRRAGSAARVTTRGRLALLAACGVVAALVALLHGHQRARAHARPTARDGAARAGAGRGRRRLPAACRGHPAAAGHHGARARAVRRRAEPSPTWRPRARPPRRCSAVDLPRVQTALRFVALEPGVADRPRHRAAARPRAPPRPTRAGSRAGAAAVAAAEAAALTRPDCPCVVALVVAADGAALRRPGAGVRVVEAAPQGVTLRELALSPLLPEQADRADPLPDDGPVP